MTPRMRICLIASLYDHACKGGAERQTMAQAAGFAEAGHVVHVVTLAEPGQADSVYDTAEGVTVHRVRLRNLYFPFGTEKRSDWMRKAWHAIDVYNPAMARALRDVLRGIAPDIVVTHKLQGFSISAWRECTRLGLCLVHALHDHELVCPATAMTRGDRLCDTPCGSCSTLSSARHALAPRPFAVIGPSHSIIERHLRFGWFRDVPRTAVIPNALPMDWPEPLARERCATPLRVGFIGRVEAAKGVDTLLDATAMLPTGALHLRIAGDGDAAEMAALRERYRNDPHVEFLGPVRARDFYPDIDLLVVPSRAHESFCNVVVEAASLGIPAIVSDRGALPERLGDGRYGWCFPAGDAPALARLLADCADDPDRVLQTGIRAMETRALHQFPAIIDLYLRTLRGWLDEHRGAACA